MPFAQRAEGINNSIVGFPKPASIGDTPGLFYFNYDEIPNGEYDYVITAKDANGSVLALGAYAQGSFSIKRGGSKVATAATSSVNDNQITPLTTFQSMGS